MREGTVEENDETLQEEYTFPNSIPSSECRKELEILNKKVIPHKIIFFISIIAFIFLCMLALILYFYNFFIQNKITPFYSNTSNKYEYVSAIICAVLCSISIVICIISKIHTQNYTDKINDLTDEIDINTQYSNFINQGFDKKEAYKLTLEWIDRQSNVEALNDIAKTNAYIATTNAYIAMHNCNNSHNHCNHR